ncbi:hypothetical protein [Nostoc sp.]|uniref:hypothetical protein n=1 Tax=Nostoc sp. TaxID=1180 RepID=UPI002FFCD5AA
MTALVMVSPQAEQAILGTFSWSVIALKTLNLDSKKMELRKSGVEDLNNLWL